MGVPAFFRWLSLKYPRIVSHCIEENAKVIDDTTTLPPDTTKPNPNNMEFDNLYLDMNGIIHPCTHPENKAAPTNEEEMFHEIFLYMDRIFNVCRPRKLMYLAVDGVAPRAKMNQQRSRRFRAGKESREKRITLAQIREDLLARGVKLPDPKDPSSHFDSNCITPGTPFMARLSIALQYYVYKKLNSDPGWKNLQVILSDASVPGEGEHKIMDYIRRQRASPSHDPNTKHILCGADADLIMLGLATHEPNFTIIREEFKPNQPKPCEMCGTIGHEAAECTGLCAEFNVGVAANTAGAEAEFIFIHINILREYLQQDLVMTGLPFKYDFERVIDDWVFMCFFVGNDFLPHLPSLEIREKAIDRLIDLYRRAVYKTHGWLTDNGSVNLDRVQLIMRDLALVEDEIFQQRRENELGMRFKNRERRNREQKFKPKRSKSDSNIKDRLEMVKPGEKFKKSSYADIMANKAAEQGQDPEELRNEELDKADEVKLWEKGYRERYYLNKFDIDVMEDSDFARNVSHAYVKGLSWVLAYYYQGCPSWDWYFPFHYAPFAVDFIDIAKVDIEFPLNTIPFRPLEQLMGVFPADSRSHVPPAWQNLMVDPNSPVIDFYPSDFRVDLNGKRFEWQGVALLPFVDEVRLLNALKECEHLLTDEERERNVRYADRYFVRATHDTAKYLLAITEEDGGTNLDSGNVLDPTLTSGITGRVWKCRNAYSVGGNVPSPITEFSEPITNLQVVCVMYSDPQFPKKFKFPCNLLQNVVLPPTTIGPNAIRQDNSHKRKHSFDSRPMQRMVRHSLAPNRFGPPNNMGQYNNFRPPPYRNVNNSNRYQDQFPHPQQYDNNQFRFNNNQHYRHNNNQFRSNNPYGSNNRPNNNRYGRY